MVDLYGKLVGTHTSFMDSMGYGWSTARPPSYKVPHLKAMSFPDFTVYHHGKTVENTPEN